MLFSLFRRILHTDLAGVENMKTIRLAAMFLLVCFATPGFAQRFPIGRSISGNDTPDKGAPHDSNKAVEIRALLTSIFPNDARTKTVEIRIIPKTIDPEPNLHRGENVLKVNEAFLEFAKGDKTFIALAVGHEFAHFEYDHWRVFRVVGWFQSEEDFNALRENEELADRSAIYHMAKAGFNICKLPTQFEKHLKEFGVFENADDPNNKVLIGRLGLMRVYCYNHKKIDAFRPPPPPEQ